MEENEDLCKSGVAQELSLLQMRKELHDIYYNHSINNLPLLERLNHFNRQHTIHVTSLYSILVEYGARQAVADDVNAHPTDRKYNYENMRRLRSICAEGLLTSMASANAMNAGLRIFHVFDIESVKCELDYLNILMNHTKRLTQELICTESMSRREMSYDVAEGAWLMASAYAGLYKFTGCRYRELFSTCHATITKAEEGRVNNKVYRSAIDLIKKNVRNVTND